MLLVVYLVMKEVFCKNIKLDDILDFIFMVFLLFIVGVCIYYVIFEWVYYFKYLVEIIVIWNGGIVIYGGLIIGVIFFVIFLYCCLINFIDFLDIVVLGVMIV